MIIELSSGRGLLAMQQCSKGNYHMMSSSRNLIYQLLLRVVMLPLFVTCSKFSLYSSPNPYKPHPCPSLRLSASPKFLCFVDPRFCRLSLSTCSKTSFTHTLPHFNITYLKPSHFPPLSKPSNKSSIPNSFSQFVCVYSLTFYFAPFVCLACFCTFLYFFVHFYFIFLSLLILAFLGNPFDLLLDQCWICLACRRMF